jgi:hypothetical protein
MFCFLHHPMSAEQAVVFTILAIFLFLPHPHNKTT